MVLNKKSQKSQIVKSTMVYQHKNISSGTAFLHTISFWIVQPVQVRQMFMQTKFKISLTVSGVKKF